MCVAINVIIHKKFKEKKTAKIKLTVNYHSIKKKHMHIYIINMNK